MIYDPRLGRFLSIDPLTQSFPWWTPYQFAGNTPIQAINLDGLEIVYITKPDPDTQAEPTLKVLFDIETGKSVFPEGETEGYFIHRTENGRKLPVSNQFGDIDEQNAFNRALAEGEKQTSAGRGISAVIATVHDSRIKVPFERKGNFGGEEGAAKNFNFQIPNNGTGKEFNIDIETFEGEAFSNEFEITNTTTGETLFKGEAFEGSAGKVQAGDKLQIKISG